MDAVRVLVLEGDPQWREALAGMYLKILGRRGTVLTAADDSGAETLLRGGAVDVLSLDLDLSQQGGGDGPLLCDTGRLQLIELAARRRWARAVVLITRDASEGRTRFILCDEAKLDEATVSPDEYVRRRFGERGLVLNQAARWDAGTSVAHFESVLRRRLGGLLRSGYTLRFAGTVHDPRVTIERNGEAVTGIEGDDVRLLVALAKLRLAGEFLGDVSVVEIYRRASAGLEPGEVRRVAQREIDGLRRRLRRQGVDDRALIRRVRKSEHAGMGAWRLEGTVGVEGVSSIRVRGRGGVDFRPDVAGDRG